MKNKEGMRKMKSKAITKLASQTETMYAAIMAKIKDAYYSIWNPRMQELNIIMDALISDYRKCHKGAILEEQYQQMLLCVEDCQELEEIVFVHGKLEQMEAVQNRITKVFEECKNALEGAVKRYESFADKISIIEEHQSEFEKKKEYLIEDYKVKVRNRIQQNIGKVQRFEELSKEEKKEFITHVILFDEGKLENTILGYLNEGEREIEQEYNKLEQKVIIAKEIMDYEESREYVHKFREDENRKSPKKYSTSRKMMEVDELEDKFETWFSSLVGNESHVGKLINASDKNHDLPIEERMYEAIEGVLDSNINNLKMTPMIEAYNEECHILRERSFDQFFGNYEEIKMLIKIINKANSIFPKWDVKEVNLMDVVL